MLLPIATQQEEDLSLEGVTGTVGIEVTEKRILLEDLQQHFGRQRLAKNSGESRLPYADDPFNGNERMG
jgi:hypothetical protein